MHQTISVNNLTFEIYLNKDQISNRLKELGKEITKKYKEKKPLFIGVLNGSFIFTADLIRHCNLECEVAFVRLSSYQGTQSSGKIKTVYGLEMDVSGRDIIVVEDIVDSGRTLHFFLDYLKKQNPASVALATLLYKPEAIKFPLKLDYVGFEIDEKFVIGYGLDYNGLCRNLENIYQLKKGT